MELHRLVEVSAAVTATRSRTAKRDLIAGLLREADPTDVALVTAYLAGTLPQRRTGIGYRSFADLPIPAAEPTLTVHEVDRALEGFAALSGPGSVTRRAEGLESLLGRATRDEQEFLRHLITGELRQGALDGVMLDGIASAYAVPAPSVRRAAMLGASAASVAEAVSRRGVEGLAGFTLTVGGPVRPMLAGSTPDVGSALTTVAPDGGDVLVDQKLDGIRVQIHRDGADVTVFTRSLDEITARLPGIVEVARSLPATRFVVDGEVIALDPETDRPLPFQVTGARTASHADPSGPAALRDDTPLTLFLFDALHIDGDDLIDEPQRVRREWLNDLAGEFMCPSVITADPVAAQRFFESVVAAGHEGVIVKDLSAPYAAGRRGSAWVKVKPRHTLDLVVLAVEWGSGRRRGTLSNIHLGARDPATGGFVMLGKTFKGMTDEMLAWQTKRFLDLEVSRTAYTVVVRPEQVVEVAFDGVQTSSRYPGGVALRFARVLRYRDDKSADEADTIDAVRALR